MLTRRSLFKSLLSAAAVAPFLNVATAQAAKVAKKLDLGSRTAKRLGYVLKAADAKNGKFKNKYKEGTNCQGCKFYKDKTADWSKCSMAGNKLVSKDAWCKSYRPRVKKA